MKKVIRWVGSLFCAAFVFTSLQAFAADNVSGNNPQNSSDSNSFGTTVNDSMITTKIKSKLAANRITNPFNISVATTNGIVTLSGEVRSVTEAETAVQIAQSTDDVKDVDATNLTLKEPSRQPVTDAYITAKVKGMFIREKLFNSDIPVSQIKVETRDGIVYLSGHVRNKSTAQRAAELAKSVNGVTSVKSTIRVAAKTR